MPQIHNMRKIIIFSFLIISLVSFSQNKTTETAQATLAQEDAEKVYESIAVDMQPVFSGGTTAFFKFVSMNFHYPDDPEFSGGKMMVTFIVEKDGSLSEIKTIKGMGFGTEQEIVRVLKMSPRWNAAMKNGEKVRTNYTIPITLYGGK